MWELDHEESWVLKNWCLWTVVLEKTLESPSDCKEITPLHLKEISPQYSLEGHGSLSWSSDTLATWCKELTHWERPWCWERLKMRGEGDDRGWDGCMASLTRQTWVWAGPGSKWWTGKPGLLQIMDHRLRLDWATELNWLICIFDYLCCLGIQNWKIPIFQLELLIKISSYNLKIVIVWINH